MGDLIRGGLHDAVGRQQFRRPQKVLQVLTPPCGLTGNGREINGMVPRAEPAGDVEKRLYARREFRGDYPQRVGRALHQLRLTAGGVEGVGERLLVWGFADERGRDPDARRARGL